MAPVSGPDNDSGGESHCRVVDGADGYYLFGNELGKMCGRCAPISDALNGSGFQFGMQYVAITCDVTPEEPRELLASPAFVLSGVDALSINGDDVPPGDVGAVIEFYRRAA